MKLLAADLGFIKGPSPFAPADEISAAESPTTFTTALSNIIGFLTILAGLAFILYFMLGGIAWITASGDAQKVETAKNQMTSAAVGLVIVVASYTIAAIVGSVLGIDILLSNPQEIVCQLSPSC